MMPQIIKCLDVKYGREDLHASFLMYQDFKFCSISFIVISNLKFKDVFCFGGQN